MITRVKIFLSFLFILASINYPQETEKEFLIKAAMIEKISHFVEWPQNTNDENFIIYILGNHPIQSYLSDLFSSRKIKNKNVTINKISKISEIKNCNVLIVSSEFRNSIPNIIAKVTKKEILTISDSDGFAEAGILFNFYNEGSSIRFELNESTLKNSDLRISYRLLNLARIIKNPGGGQ
ncbi:MAG: YfiR family protein [Melioribacteraceae bacterium]|nr:YfiR family protein [Melioribacteraceae bacterium]